MEVRVRFDAPYEQNVRVLRLRPFSEGDDAQLLTWFHTRNELERFAGEGVAWPLTAEQLGRWRADPGIRAWSAWRPPDVEFVLGHIQLVRTGSAAARLARVAVAPSSRGKGHGRALVIAALEQARFHRINSVDLNVYQDNEPAVRLYASLGFADLGPSTENPEVKRMGRNLLADSEGSSPATCGTSRSRSGRPPPGRPARRD